MNWGHVILLYGLAYSCHPLLDNQHHLPLCSCLFFLFSLTFLASRQVASLHFEKWNPSIHYLLEYLEEYCTLRFDFDQPSAGLLKTWGPSNFLPCLSCSYASACCMFYPSIYLGLCYRNSFPVICYIITAINIHSFTNISFFLSLEINKTKTAACFVTEKLKSPAENFWKHYIWLLWP